MKRPNNNDGASLVWRKSEGGQFEMSDRKRKKMPPSGENLLTVKVGLCWVEDLRDLSQRLETWSVALGCR